MVNLMLQLDKISAPQTDNTHANRIKVLRKEGMLPNQIDDILYALRMNRNKVVHANLADQEQCKTLLRMTYNLAVWFIQVYGDINITVNDFSMPVEYKTNYASLVKEKETLIQELSAKIKDIQAQDISQNERIKKSNHAVSFMKLSEKETRYLIDEQLRRVGWEVDTETIRYSNGVRPQKGENLAIAEWPTENEQGEKGYADYVLFVGLKMVGIIEAKKTSLDVPSIIDAQGKEYAKNVTREYYKDRVAEAETEYVVSSKKGNYQFSNWNGYKVPFVFVTNGPSIWSRLKQSREFGS